MLEGLILRAPEPFQVIVVRLGGEKREDDTMGLVGWWV